MKRTTIAILIVAALGAGTAMAQTPPMSPGPERTPSGASVTGDTREMPGADTRMGQPPIADRYRDSTVAPATPAYRSDAGRSSWRDRWYSWRDRWFSPRTEPLESHAWERGGKDGPYGTGLGGPQYRFDGPDQGRFVNPSQA